MPLALPLSNAIAVLRAAASALGPWTEIVPLEATVVERARSRFLVDWFGPRLPFDGLSLRVYVMNIDELAGRYLLAQRSIPTSPGGPNLTNPVLGFAGMLAGLVLTPAGAVAGVIVMLRFLGATWKTVLGAIGWIVFSGLLTFMAVVRPLGSAALVGSAIAALGAAQGLFMGLGDRRVVRAAYNLFGALAQLMSALLLLLGQLAGPREGVRNPLLAQLLLVADRIAALYAQMVGAVAVVYVRIGPMLAPVAATLVGLGGLVRAVGGALTEVMAGTTARVDDLRSGGLSLAPLIARVTAVGQRQIDRIVDQVTAQMTLVGTVLREVGAALGAMRRDFMAKLEKLFPALARRHPAVQVVEAFRRQIAIISAAWPKEDPSQRSKAKGGAAAALTAAFPERPGFPDLPSLPDAAKVRAALDVTSRPPLTFQAIELIAAQLGRERPSHLALGAEAEATIDRALARPSVFAPERSALEAGLKRTPFAALALNLEQLAGFREALEVVVGRVLPPEMRGVYAPKLAETLTAIDRRLYGVHGPEPAELPVLDLPTSDRLRPVVTQLRLRVPGAELTEARRFGDLLLERLRGRTYEVAAAGAP